GHIRKRLVIRQCCERSGWRERACCNLGGPDLDVSCDALLPQLEAQVAAVPVGQTLEETCVVVPERAALGGSRRVEQPSQPSREILEWLDDRLRVVRERIVQHPHPGLIVACEIELL